VACGEAPVDKRLGAYWSQRVQLWWQQFLLIFLAKIQFLVGRRHPTRSNSPGGTRHHCPVEVVAYDVRNIQVSFGSAWGWGVVWLEAAIDSAEADDLLPFIKLHVMLWYKNYSPFSRCLCVWLCRSYAKYRRTN